MSNFVIRTSNVVGAYALYYDDADTVPYKLFRWTGQFWQQVGPAYYRKGNAVRKYSKLINQPLN